MVVVDLLCMGFLLRDCSPSLNIIYSEVPLSLELPLKLELLITSNVRPNPGKLGEYVANCTLKS